MKLANQIRIFDVLNTNKDQHMCDITGFSIWPIPKLTHTKHSSLHFTENYQWKFQHPKNGITVPYKATFCGHIPLHDPYVRFFLYDRYPQFGTCCMAIEMMVTS